MDIETVTIFRTWVEIAAALKTDAERGKLYHAICKYSLYGKEPQLDGILNTYFTIMRPSIDKSNKRKIAQQKSLQMRLQNSLQNDLQTNSLVNRQVDLQTNLQNDSSRAHKTGTGTDKKTVSTETEKETPVSFAVHLPDHLTNSLFEAKWKEWEAYRRSKRKPISQFAFRQMKKQLASMTQEEAIEAINTSIANDWQGLFPPKNRPNHPMNGQPVKKDYSGV